MVTTLTHTRTGFDTLGDLLVAVVRAGKGQGVDPRLEAVAGSDEHHGMSIERGGATVPDELLREALTRRGDSDPVLSRVTRIPLSHSFAKVPARVDSNHSTSVSGGLTLARRPETSAIDTSRMEMEQIGFASDSLCGAAYVSDELMADSPIETLLERAFLDELNAVLLREFISGTGVGESLGILSSPALISIDTTGQTTGTITGANLTAMAGRTWHYDREAVWLANPDTRSILDAAHVTFTSGDRPCVHYEAGQAYLLGRPLYFSEQCAALSTVGDIICGVWGEYLLGVRQEGTMESSIHVRFENFESTLRFTFRGAGAPWWRAQLTPRNGAATLSPFVALATRTT